MSKRGNIFTSKESLKTIDTLRVSYLIVAILFFLITEAGRKIYRPYIYSNDIDDFGLADSIGNLGGIIVQIFFGLAILNPQNHKVLNLIAFFVGGYILYEILQPVLPRGVFDWNDVYGTFAGGIISLFIYFLLKKLINRKLIYKFN